MNKSFFGFNQPTALNPIEEKISRLENKINNMKLMYRSPGSDSHENITQTLDKLFNKLDNIEARLTILEDIHFDSGK